MMRYIFSLIVALVVTSPILAGEPDKLLHEKCIYPTVMIDDPTNGDHGTGAIVRSERLGNGLYLNVVLTCAHVLKDNCQHRLFYAEYREWSHISNVQVFNLEIFAIDREKDLGVVYFVSPDKLFTADLGFEEKLYLGNDILSVGCGQRKFPRLSYGKVTQLLDYSNKVEATLTVIPGDSGGPVYHNYKIVGVVQYLQTVHMKDGQKPVFSLAGFIDIKNFQEWDKEIGHLGFLKKANSLPALPKVMSEVRQFHLR